MFDRLIHDIRFAFRQIVRHPGFSLRLTVTVAVAIGANVAIFSVLEGIVLRPLPYQDSDRLLAIWESPEGNRRTQPFSSPDYFDVREQSGTMDEVGAVHQRFVNLSGDGDPQRLRAGAATASLMTLLGVQPELGRLFLEEEELEGNDRVAILSHGLWQNEFGGDPDIVGQTTMINGQASEIIGVMPASFRFPTPFGGRDRTRLWQPLVLSRDNDQRSSHWLGVYGRMADGVTPEAVESELGIIAMQLAEAYPASNAQTRMWVQPMMERTLGGVQSTLIYLLVIVGLVLLIACANVAAMLMARGMTRSSEFAIRASIGAGRRGLIRQLVTESVLLCGLGGVAGVAMAYWGVGAIKLVLPNNIPRTTEIGVNLQVLGFAAGVTLLTGLLVGLAPAMFAARTNLATVIKQGTSARGGGAGRNRILSGLVAAQLAIGFVMVNAALLLAASYSRVMNQETNFATDEVLVASLSLAGPAYDARDQRRAFLEEVVSRTRALPGVTRAAVTSKLPLNGGTNGGVLVREQVFDPDVQQNWIEHSFVDEEYHTAMGIPLLSGRLFDRRDLEEAAAAAEAREAEQAQDPEAEAPPMEVPILVNRTMAEEKWPNANPLGEIVRPSSETEYYRARVVGVVEDVRQWGAEREPIGEMYFPHTAELWGPIWANLVVRASGDPVTLVPALRQVVHEVDDQIPVGTPFTMAQALRNATASRRFSMMLVGMFAATALLLIVAGTYGVVAFSVSQRVHEVGVRMALGADRGRVMRLFMRRATWLFVPGLFLGLIGSMSAAGLTRSRVYGISALSPTYLVAAGVIMLLVGVAATAIPVVRATRVDPLEALRAE